MSMSRSLNHLSKSAAHSPGGGEESAIVLPGLVEAEGIVAVAPVVVVAAAVPPPGVVANFVSTPGWNNTLVNRGNTEHSTKSRIFSSGKPEEKD